MEQESQRSVVIAITGGIGSGKTTAANIIRESGATVLSSDDKAKEITANNEIVKEKLLRKFGEMVFLDDGSINKEFLSSKVFGETKERRDNLAALNSIVHPLVIDNMIDEVQKLEDAGEKLIFVESALTFEAGLEEGFDYIVVVDSEEDNCIERVMQRSGLSEQQVRLRMANQINPVEKRKAADFVINNNGSIEELKTSVNFILAIVKNLKPRDLEEEE